MPVVLTAPKQIGMDLFETPPTAMPGVGGIRLGFSRSAPPPIPAKPPKTNLAKGWSWADGMLYKEPFPLRETGTCNGGRGLYHYYTGAVRILQFIEHLEWIADAQKPFVLDFETGARKIAPVDPVTGQFDLTRLSYAVANGDDTKHTGSDPHTSVVFLAAISFQKNVSHAVDVREALRLFPVRFRQALADACDFGKMIAHNAVFECIFVRAITGRFVQCAWDTMILTRLSYPGLPETTVPWLDPKKPLRLGADADSVLLREMGVRLDKRWQKFFLRLHPETGLLNEMIEYVCGDTACMLELTAILVEKLQKSQTYHLWTTFERPFLPILARNKYEGVPIDIAQTIVFRDEAQTELDELLTEWNRRNPRVSHSSNPQTLAMFVERYPRREITEVDVAALEEIQEWEKDPDVDLLLKIRQVERVYTTYLVPWVMTMRNPVTGNIHTDYSQNDTATGRMASRNPNLQNIPSKSHWRKIRSVFRASPGNLFIGRDLSQFEVRALASMADEQDMIAFFNKAWEVELKIREEWAKHPEYGYKTEDALKKCTDPIIKELLKEKKKTDFHTLNAMAIYAEVYTEALQRIADDQLRIGNLRESDARHPDIGALESQINELQEMVDRMRKEVKALTFGIPYGVTARKVAADFKIALADAQAKIDKYYETWRRIKAFLERCEYRARTRFESVSPTGRKRLFPRINHFSQNVQKGLLRGFERQAKNFPIQSINSDVLKLACILMAPTVYSLGGSFRLWVHDEVVVESPSAHVTTIADEMERCLILAAQQCGITNCPIETSCDIAQHWAH